MRVVRVGGTMSIQGGVALARVVQVDWWRSKYTGGGQLAGA